jgi:formylglycine-generating enzyme required for sulfatase activity
MRWRAMLLQHQRSDSRLIEMVTLPAGVFSMGAAETETGHHAAETPRHTVVIEEPFAVSRYAVTVGQFAAFAEVTGHQQGVCQLWRNGAWKEEAGSFLNPGFEQGSDHPVVCVGWYDAQAFIAWLSTMTGEPYRLLTEAEWEYAARVGTSTRYWWGETATPKTPITAARMAHNE